MGNHVADQALVFAGALVLGLTIGLVYDLFRVLRVRVRLRLLGPALDLLFWLLVTVSLFLFVISVGDGEVRLYIISALFGGAVIYFLLFSSLILSLAYRTADLFTQIVHICLLPIRWF